MSSSGNNNTGSGSGSTIKSHSEGSRSNASAGPISLSSDSSHFPNKSSGDTNFSTNVTTSSHQRVAVTTNSQDCSPQYIQTKDTGLPQR